MMRLINPGGSISVTADQFPPMPRTGVRYHPASAEGVTLVFRVPKRRPRRRRKK